MCDQAVFHAEVEYGVKDVIRVILPVATEREVVTAVRKFIAIGRCAVFLGKEGNTKRIPRMNVGILGGEILAPGALAFCGDAFSQIFQA